MNFALHRSRSFCLKTIHRYNLDREIAKICGKSLLDLSERTKFEARFSLCSNCWQNFARGRVSVLQLFDENLIPHVLQDLCKTIRQRMHYTPVRQFIRFPMCIKRLRATFQIPFSVGSSSFKSDSGNICYRLRRRWHNKTTAHDSTRKYLVQGRLF